MDDKEFIEEFRRVLYTALLRELAGRVAANDFIEAEHPRDKIGRFTRKGSGQFALKATKRSVRFLKNFGKVKDPKTIAGVKKGKAKTFEQSRKVNPKSDDIGFKQNCTNAVLAYILNRRGYDVQAAPNYFIGKGDQLAYNSASAWLNPLTGKECKYKKINNIISAKACFYWFKRNIKPGGIYQFVFGLKNGTDGHAVAIDRDEKGEIRLYDAQEDLSFVGKEAIIFYFEKFCKASFNERDTQPKILRVDNKNVNPYYLDEAVVKRD